MQRVFEKLEPGYAALDARATILPDRDRCLPGPVSSCARITKSIRGRTLRRRSFSSPRSIVSMLMAMCAARPSATSPASEKPSKFEVS
jgi:hypothetical protein